MSMSMCEPAGRAAPKGLRSTNCSEVDSGDVCRYHQGTEDAAIAAIDAISELFDVAVYLAPALNPSMRFQDETTGEVCEGPLGGLVRYIVASVGRGSHVTLSARAVSSVPQESPK